MYAWLDSTRGWANVGLQSLVMCGRGDTESEGKCPLLMFPAVGVWAGEDAYPALP